LQQSHLNKEDSYKKEIEELNKSLKEMFSKTDKFKYQYDLDKNILLNENQLLKIKIQNFESGEEIQHAKTQMLFDMNQVARKFDRLLAEKQLKLENNSAKHIKEMET